VPCWVFDDFFALAQGAAHPDANLPVNGYLTSPYDSLLTDGFGVPWAGLVDDNYFSGRLNTPENLAFLERIAELYSSGALLIWRPKMSPDDPGIDCGTQVTSG
jgi:hypothetical protein